MEGIDLAAYGLPWLRFLAWGWWIFMISYTIGVFYLGYRTGKARAKQQMGQMQPSDSLIPKSEE